MGSERALLVAAGGGIGDTLLAGVVAHALRSRYAAVDALVLPAHRTVAEHDPVYGRVIDWDGALGSANALRGERYAAAVVTWATLPAALAGLLAGIPVRVGQSRRLYSPLFTKRVAVRSESGDHTTPWTQILLDYARALGCNDAAAQPAFVPTAEDTAAAAGLLHAHGVATPYRVLHPTRGLSAQRARWPAAGFIRLAQALRARDDVPLLISGSADDAAFAATIARATGAITVAGATTLGAFGALAAGAHAVVAMDSGPMHIAAAVGAPTVGVFALESDEPERWAPRGPRIAVVRATYPCPPSHRKETCPDFACVDALDVNGILGALDGLDRARTEAS